ncbi:ankyrin repeat-containing protein [Aspergillus nomiae NRRL 13137]|uniref:Ankyrin repeat-containing protein n=1 Tax=Aspergillus nomiae NRRL (strain ATCC 15546 / NRRL 13137 / CBS 260.88 / M93) TaxID=1509407 RepID=A0A0L1J170_ASPN3|nr:ankyrin repeat-containing protein [Aspergillus nomiae NRRL 13137]KNG85415.1 ankyrin repeat-containing protein [Aspergillus nomiae NRRL 13137]
MATLARIPREVLYYIVDYLGPEDLTSLLVAYPDITGHLTSQHLSVAGKMVLHLLADSKIEPDPALRDMAVERLKQNSAIPVNSCDKQGCTPLWIAANRGYGKMVKLLLGRKDLEPDIPNTYGVTPLEQVVITGDKAMVKLLLAHGGIDPIRQYSYDRKKAPQLCPLSTAATMGRAAIVKLLVEYSPKEQLESAVALAFKCAACNGREEVMEILINGVENVNFQIENGQSVLLYTYSKGYRSIAKQLLTKNGIDAGWEGDNGRTMLDIAVDREDIEMVELLKAREDVKLSSGFATVRQT